MDCRKGMELVLSQPQHLWERLSFSHAHSNTDPKQPIEVQHDLQKDGLNNCPLTPTMAQDMAKKVVCAEWGEFYLLILQSACAHKKETIFFQMTIGEPNSFFEGDSSC